MKQKNNKISKEEGIELCTLLEKGAYGHLMEAESSFDLTKGSNQQFTSDSVFCECMARSRWRRTFLNIANNKYFENFIMLVILSNCFLMAIEPPKADSNDQPIWKIMEYVFQIIYTIEMFIKIFAQGLIFDKYTYLRDGWNVVDFVIVLSSWITIFLGNTSISVIRTVRVLRTLRTLSVFP